MPLYTVLLALGNPTVHHFSLDVEGAEFPILKTIPWDKVRRQMMGTIAKTTQQEKKNVSQKGLQSLTDVLQALEKISMGRAMMFWQ